MSLITRGQGEDRDSTPDTVNRVGAVWADRIAAGGALMPAHTSTAVELLPAKADRMKRELIQRYQGQTLADVYGVARTPTAEGLCPTIEFTSDLPVRILDGATAHHLLRHDLELVAGIGPYWAERHRQAGCRTLEGLIGSRFWPSASAILTDLDQNPAATFFQVRQRHGPSHPALWWTTGLFRPEDLLFLDLETLGLWGASVILVGVAEATPTGVKVTQYIAETVDDEPALIVALTSHLAGKAALVTFNGRSFDWPMIRARAAYYGIPFPYTDRPHYDVLHFARRAWQLPNYQAATIEASLLGVERADDLPGSYVPEFYETYRRRGNIGPLVYILEHNRQDLLGLVGMCGQLTVEWGNGDAD